MKALVVLGHSRLGRLSGRSLSLIQEAEALADRDPPRVVVFTGRSRFGPSEGSRMLSEWRGRRDVELVAEDTASSTSQNASRSLRLLVERGVDRATVVCAQAHARRVRFLFRDLYAEFGVECDIHAVAIRATPPVVGWELGARLIARRQQRAASAELRAIRRD